jgi:two-component system OmpR family response regulator
MQILVVEDEHRMAKLLHQGLTEEGHCVTLAANGRDGLELASGHFDVIVLDVMLPGLDGLEVARRLRGRSNQTPILMLTARDANRDVVTGLDAGADDYLTKPFSFEVLLAHLRAVARRGPIARGVSLRVGPLTLDPATHEVRRDGKTLAVSRTEFSLLEMLMRNAGRVISRDALIAGVWGWDAEVENNTLDVFVHLLRAKVEPTGGPRLIHTVRGIGYRLLDHSQEGDEA